MHIYCIYVYVIHTLNAHICIYEQRPCASAKIEAKPKPAYHSTLQETVRSTGMHIGVWVSISPASFGWSEDNKNNLDRKFGFNLHIWKVVITCLLHHKPGCLGHYTC